MSWLQTVSLPLVSLIVLVALLVAMEAGYRGRRWLDRRGAAAAGNPPDHLLSAVLGLLALLLGFTFSLALNRYEARRELVVQEANAIGTTWLRAQLLEEPGRAAMRDLLRDYVEVRLTWSRDGTPDASLDRTAAVQQQLWTAMGAVMRTDSSQQLARALMDAMNDSFDAASSRAIARSAHIPGEVVDILLLYAVLSAVMLGYMTGGADRPHRLATVLLLTLLSLALVLILDIDRPLNGGIQVSQQPLRDLRASM